MSSAASSGESQQQQEVRLLLLGWRENLAARLGLSSGHQLYCARHSMVMHDIFIDAIAKAAPSINSLADFHNVAKFWKWIDAYGDEVYSLLQSHLNTYKRVGGSSAMVESDRKRVRCY